MDLENMSHELPDLGSAAVRGEAVAGLDGWKIGNACNGSIVIQKEGLGGCLAERDSESIAESILYELACSVRYAPVSARAADAPSEPTSLSRQLRTAANADVGIDLAKLLIGAAEEIDRYYGGMLAWKKTAEKKDRDWQAERMERVNDRIKSRAADALDSQPTECPIPWEQRIPAHVRQIGTACSEIDYVKAELAEWRASSQPTDGGVRNG